MKICTIILSFFLAINVVKAENEPPWISALGEKDVVNNTFSIETVASVKVSDGLTYKAVTSWQSNKHLVFHRIYSDKQITLMQNEDKFWQISDGVRKASSSEIGDFIRGHQFHAELIFFKLFEYIPKMPEPDSNDTSAYLLSTVDIEGNPTEFYYNKDSRRPEHKIINHIKYGKISVDYNDWRSVGELYLPFQINIEHKGRSFDYRYTEINLNSIDKYKRLFLNNNS